MASKRFTTIDEYLSSLPDKSTREACQLLRKTIRQAVPGSEELISYNMPAFKYYGVLAYFAVHREHIGFYPYPSVINAFKDKLNRYETSKGTVQFPLGKPIPVNLVRDMVKFKAKENLEKATAKTKKKKA